MNILKIKQLVDSILIPKDQSSSKRKKRNRNLVLGVSKISIRRFIRRGNLGSIKCQGKIQKLLLKEQESRSDTLSLKSKTLC